MSEETKKTIHIVPATSDTFTVCVSIDSDGDLWLEEPDGGYYGDNESLIIPKDHLKSFMEAVSKAVSDNE